MCCRTRSVISSQVKEEEPAEATSKNNNEIKYFKWCDL